MSAGHQAFVAVDLARRRNRLDRTDEKGKQRATWHVLLTVPTVVFLASRCVFLALGQIAPHILSAGQNQPVLPRHDMLATTWTSVWFRFDTSWYVGVARHGYHWGALGVANTNFFPLYPLLVRALKPLSFGDVWLSAWLVANTAYLVALIYLWRWALLRWRREVAVRFLILFCAFPFSLFFFVPYAEPVFLAAAAAAFCYAEENRWGLATAAGALAVASRPVGVAVLLGLFVMAWQRHRRREAGLTLLSAAPLAAFSAYLALAFGHPLGLLTYHSAGWVAPRSTLVSTLAAQFHTNLSPFDRVDALAAGLFLASGVVVWRRMGAPYGLYVLIGVLLPLAHGLVSMERYVTVLFPAVAAWASCANKAAQIAIFSVMLVAFILATTMFVSGYAIF